MLAKALQSHYGKDGLACEFRLFKDVSELRGAGLTLAVIHISFLVDHYVVVLQVTDESVIVADPLSGKRTLSHQEFANKWRLLGITLKKPPAISQRLAYRPA
jgi:ABC-type bacteriocin/lantibiotic exporter with double-glycine peptidase domain